MGTAPIVSVVIPVYNIEAHLRQCLDSVAGQTLQDIEIICVDDGSTDSSPEILDEYGERDARFCIIHQENAGPGSARNRGINEATGEYLIFLDSDDWFEANFLEKMVKRSKETLADITICRSVEFDTNTIQTLPSEWMLKTEYLPGDTFSPKEISNYVFQFTYGWPWDKLYRTKFVKESALEYPPLPNSEDLVFVFQSLALAERIALVENILIHHRVNRVKSVSNSRCQNPESPYKAAKLLEETLHNWGIYETFQQSFLNWTIEFLIWNVANLKDREIQKQSFHRLRKEWIPEFHFWKCAVSDYNRFSYLKLILAWFAPFPIFQGVNRLYHIWKYKRGEEGNGEALSSL